MFLLPTSRRSSPSGRARVLLLILAGLYALASGGAARAHELPERVTVRMIASTQENTLDMMVRVPLEAMRDVDFPLTPEGYLILDEAGNALTDAAGLWVVDSLALRVRGQLTPPRDIALRIALPGDRAFATYATARDHFAAPPLPADTQIFWRQAMLDVRLVYPLPTQPTAGDLTLDAAFRQLGATTRVELLFIGPDGDAHNLSFDGDARNLALMPSGWRVAGDFLHEGFVHILGGIDHLLFLLCLVLPLRQPWPLVKAVTAFTVAHSVTLAAAALGWIPTPLWFASLVEAIIALSIVYLALENILRDQVRHRWVTAFVFGLAHGFGFASALRDSLQFAQGQIPVALASFNVGVEIGQLLVLALLLPLSIGFFNRVPSERIALIVISALIAHTGWHWMTERLATLSGYFF